MNRVWVTPKNLAVWAVGFNDSMSSLEQSARQRERRGDRGVAACSGSTVTIPVLGSPVLRHRSDTVVLPEYRTPRRRHRRAVLRNEPVTWLVVTAMALFGLAVVLLFVSLRVPSVDASLVDRPTPALGPAVLEPTTPPPVVTTPEPEPPPRVDNDSDRRAGESALSPSVPDVSLSDDLLNRYVPRGIFPGG